MLTHGQLWLLGLVQMASFGLVIVVGAWVTLLLTTNLALTPKSAGALGSLVLLIGIVSRPIGGYLVGRLGVRTLLTVSLYQQQLAHCLCRSGSEDGPWPYHR